MFFLKYDEFEGREQNPLRFSFRCNEKDMLILKCVAAHQHVTANRVLKQALKEYFELRYYESALYDFIRKDAHKKTALKRGLN